MDRPTVFFMKFLHSAAEIENVLLKAYSKYVHVCTVDATKEMFVNLNGEM